MRALRVLLATALLLAAMGSAAQAAKPPVVTLHWQLVAPGVTAVNATDRYLAYETSAGLTVVDQQTHAVTELPATACPAPEHLAAAFGGPWVATCAFAQPQQAQLPLYNIVEHQWVQVPWPGCSDCAPLAVGSQWIEIVYGCQEHCAPTLSLENIASGRLEADPVRPHVNFRENLDSPTGTSPLCAPLRYPAWFDGEAQQLEPGYLSIHGQFALTTPVRGGRSLLERCHSSWHKWLDGLAIGGSRMVVWSDNHWASGHRPDPGLLLPSLRRFNFVIPRRLRPRPGPSLGIALSGRTIYVLSPDHTLWAARVPRIA
jgi:hypothetical protein